MRHHTQLEPHGLVWTRQVCERPLEEAISDATRKALGWVPQEKEFTHNLIVDGGRARLARLLGGASTATIDRMVLGEGQKTGNAPALSDTSLVQELSQSNGAANGIYAIDDVTEKFYPSAAAIFPADPLVDWASSGGVVTITAGVTQLTGASGVNFLTAGVTRGHRLTLSASGTEVTFVITRVVDSTTLELFNPSGYETPALATNQYRVDSSGTQLLISKTFRGNDFPEADWGPFTLITEAGLLCQDGTLFNRVVYVPDQENQGLLLQPDDGSGTEISIAIEWLITF